MRFVQRQQPEAQEARPDLADEALAYLRGRSFERRRRGGPPAPSWVYLNIVAHCEAADLRRLALMAPDGVRAPTTWAEAVTTLAAGVVEQSEGDEVLMRHIQLGRLARLEDRLIAAPERAPDPRALTSLGEAYLYQHPSAR